MKKVINNSGKDLKYFDAIWLAGAAMEMTEENAAEYKGMGFYVEGEGELLTTASPVMVEGSDDQVAVEPVESAPVVEPVAEEPSHEV